MVLESLTNPFRAENRPSVLILLGFLYCSVAIGLSLWIFPPSQVSLVMVFLTAMACIPLIYNTIKAEEEKDLQDMGERWLMKEHAKALKAFMALFIGITLACTFWLVVLPSDTVDDLFESQEQTYLNMIRGRATDNSGEESKFMRFSGILLNNVKVLIFIILFSFVYGAGAIFILSWNASVIGYVMGASIREKLAFYATLVGFDKAAHYLGAITVGLLQFVIHGIPEILAYFVGALAGGIISVAIIRHDFGTRKFEHILLDSADLVLLSLFLIFFAAFLEVWITPMIFF